MNEINYGEIITLVLCIITSGFFSASETAITSLSTLKTKQLIDASEKKVKHLNLWLKHPGRVITTILIFNNLVNIFASAITTTIALRYFPDFAVGIATFATTMIILIFGEVIPKSFAKANAEPLAITTLKFIAVFYRLAFPAVLILSEFAGFIIKKLGSKDISMRPTITEEELEFIIAESESAGVIKEFKRDMIEGVFDFDEIKVREVMTPRTDISGIDKTDTFDEVVKQSIRTGHSRIPVYEDNIDVVVGIVFAKDLLRLLSSNGNGAKISDIMREAFFVPESKPIIDVFKDLKRTKNHMAIVIDEHGGTAGLVTMEDILEEIVGEIQDEFDVEEAKILEIETNVFDMAGSVSINELVDYFDLDESLIEDIEQDVDTAAGLVTHLSGDMPKVGQKTILGPLELEVTEVGRFRIERLRVTKSILPTTNESDD